MAAARTLEFRQAIAAAIDDELAADERVIFFGEDVAAPGGVFAVTPGLQERHGADRVFDTPISELAMTGAAFGSAVTGSRPVIEIMFGDFMPLAMDSLVNQAAKYWFVSDGQASVPLVVRSAVGAGGRFGAIHSQSPVPWFLGVPGLKIVAPSNPDDAYWLLRAAIRDDNPVLFFEHKRLYSNKGEVGAEPQRLGVARTVRAGDDVTVVAAMAGVAVAVDAAEALAAEGVGVEVIDLRTLAPFDLATVSASLERTGRLVVVDEGPRTGGWSAALVAELMDSSLDYVDDICRVTTRDLPIPFSPALEDAFLPDAESVAAAIRSRIGVAAGG